MKKLNQLRMWSYAVGFCLLCGLVQAAAVKEKAVYAPVNSEPLVSPVLINEVGWTSNWQMNLPLKVGEKIDRLGVLGGDLYVLSDKNIMFCIDRQKGRLRFAHRLGSAQVPVQRPFYHNDQFWFIVGSEMLVFDPKVGDFVVREKFEQVGTSAECGLARNNQYIYISGSDNRIHAINADGFWEKFAATADNDSAIVSIQATDDIVVFATSAGNVVGMQPNEARKVWQFDATGEINGNLVLDGEEIYFGSLDSKLYKLNLRNGQLVWDSPFHSGAPIRDFFTVGRDAVYLYNALNGLYGVDRQTGKGIWCLNSGEGMICESNHKGFIYACPGILKVMDNATGQELYSMNISQVKRYASNTRDSVMYLADTTGRLMSVTVH